MTTDLSAAIESEILEPVITGAYVSLHVTVPGPTGLGEVTGGGYVRQGPITFARTGPNPTVDHNATIISFPTATSDWGTVSHFGIWSAQTGGAFRGANALVKAKPILTESIARFLAGALTITAR